MVKTGGQISFRDSNGDSEGNYSIRGDSLSLFVEGDIEPCSLTKIEEVSVQQLIGVWQGTCGSPNEGETLGGTLKFFSDGTGMLVEELSGNGDLDESSFTYVGDDGRFALSFGEGTDIIAVIVVDGMFVGDGCTYQFDDPAGVPNDYVSYQDAETGFSLEHPPNWVELARPEGSSRLLLNAGGDSSLSVRVEPSPNHSEVDTPEQLAEAQTVTDRIAGRPGVEVVKREVVEVNGMLGVCYLSRFIEEASGTRMTNVQYFLFKGNIMHIVLFQAVPEEEFDRLASDFDNVLASFQGATIDDLPQAWVTGGD